MTKGPLSPYLDIAIAAALLIAWMADMPALAVIGAMVGAGYYGWLWWSTQNKP